MTNRLVQQPSRRDGCALAHVKQHSPARVEKPLADLHLGCQLESWLKLDPGLTPGTKQLAELLSITSGDLSNREPWMVLEVTPNQIVGVAEPTINVTIRAQEDPCC